MAKYLQRDIPLVVAGSKSCLASWIGTLSHETPRITALAADFLSVPGLAAQMYRSMIESVSLSVCYTGLVIAFNSFTQTVSEFVKDAGSLYIVDWELWGPPVEHLHY